MMRAQDMIFTLYGDYLRYRGGEAPTAALIRLLGHLGMSEVAVRSNLSRMARKGWLKGRRLGRVSFYAMTDKMAVVLEEGAQRIFTAPEKTWDSRWHLLAYSMPEVKRRLRNRLRNGLTWLGYGMLGNGLWVSPHDRGPEVQRLVEALQLNGHVAMFYATYAGLTAPQELVARCWDLQGLNQRYAAFIAAYRPKFSAHRAQLEAQNPVEPGECFAQRFRLIHEYRAFPFIDPHLPAPLLPPGWLGDEAHTLFRTYHELLAAGANQFVDTVLSEFGAKATGAERGAHHGY